MAHIELLDPLSMEHMAAVEAIQIAVYPRFYHEDISCISARAKSYPDGSFVWRSESSGAIVAYCTAYPWPLAAALLSPPSLGTVDTAAIDAACRAPGSSCIFLHEVSVWEQGAGIGRALVDAVLKLGALRGFTDCLLVSVLGNDAYYERLGFHSIRALPPYTLPDAPPSSHSGGGRIWKLAPRPSHYSTDMRATLMRLVLPTVTCSPMR